MVRSVVTLSSQIAGVVQAPCFVRRSVGGSKKLCFACGIELSCPWHEQDRLDGSSVLPCLLKVSAHFCKQSWAMTCLTPCPVRCVGALFCRAPYTFSLCSRTSLVFTRSQQLEAAFNLQQAQVLWQLFSIRSLVKSVWTSRQAALHKSLCNAFIGLILPLSFVRPIQHIDVQTRVFQHNSIRASKGVKIWAISTADPQKRNRTTFCTGFFLLPQCVEKTLNKQDEQDRICSMFCLT